MEKRENKRRDGSPGVHVGGGRDDLGGAHLLHALQSLLSLGGVQVGMGTLARDLKQSQSDPTQVLERRHNTKSGQGMQRTAAGFKGFRFESSISYPAMILYGFSLGADVLKPTPCW